MNTARRSFRQFHAYSETLLGLNRPAHRQIIGCVYRSASLDVIKQKVYQYACGFAGGGCVVRVLRQNRCGTGYVCVLEFVKNYDARRLTVAGWKELFAKHETLEYKERMNRADLDRAERHADALAGDTWGAY